jgi:polyisoprenoid-binding protein YceI
LHKNLEILLQEDSKYMKRIATIAIFGLVTMFALAACGLLEEPAAPSGAIEAIPLEIEAPDLPTEAASEATDSSPEEEIAGEPAAAEESTETGASGLVIYTISPEESQVRFELDEDLGGIRNTVIGTTNQVAGEIALDSSDPSSTQVGIILINARALVTDNDFRNRAIQNRILNTGSFEFIEFAPSAIEGMPDTVGLGETVDFVIVGDLTIRDITNEVSFEVKATLVSEDEITGTASSVVSREDYGLSIPEVPRVANVEEDVEITIDFVAKSG